MQKPNGYDEASDGSFSPVDLGGHYAIIKQVTEKQSSTGKDMVVVLFDFVSPDKQAGYHTKAFEASPRRKWPFNGSRYIMVRNNNDPNKTDWRFKAFCTSFQQSNGVEIKWGGDDWDKQFVGKKIGVVYGEEEHEYDGKRSMRRLPVRFCSWDSVATAEIPDPTYLASKPSASVAKPDDFINVPDTEDEEIPF